MVFENIVPDRMYWAKLELLKRYRADIENLIAGYPFKGHYLQLEIPKTFDTEKKDIVKYATDSQNLQDEQNFLNRLERKR